MACRVSSHAKRRSSARNWECNRSSSAVIPKFSEGPGISCWSLTLHLWGLLPHLMVLIAPPARRRLVEAGGIEPPSATVLPRLLRACPVHKSRFVRCRPAGHARNQCPRKISPLRPVTHRQSQPAIYAPTRPAGVGGGTSRNLSRESQLRVGFCVVFPDDYRGQPGSSARHRGCNRHVETGRPQGLTLLYLRFRPLQAGIHAAGSVSLQVCGDIYETGGVSRRGQSGSHTGVSQLFPF